MEDLERIKERLDNLRSVEPILTALRTIAAGSLRLARSRLETARIFAEELRSIYVALRPLLRRSATPEARRPSETPSVGLVVIASERGLCGAFNTLVGQAAERFLTEYREEGRRVEIIALGARAASYFRRRGITPAWTESLPMTTVASLAFVRRLHARLRAEHQAGRFETVQAVYMPYHVRGAMKPVSYQVMPIEMTAPQEEPPWPTPIIDTDPQLLYERVMRQWSVIELYRCVMESAASEQAARFQVLDGASNNCQRLIEELTLNYHVARQHAITMEMLDLVGGSGLLKSEGSK